MHEVQRRDGSLAVFGDDGDKDELIAEGVVARFTPTHGSQRCTTCGTTREPELRSTTTGAELYCGNCHKVFCHLDLGVRTYR
jgi:hypothetical protein